VDYLIAKGANTVTLENIAAQEAMRTINDSPPCEGVYQRTITPEPQVCLDTLLSDTNVPARMARTSGTFHRIINYYCVDLRKQPHTHTFQTFFFARATRFYLELKLFQVLFVMLMLMIVL